MTQNGAIKRGTMPRVRVRSARRHLSRSAWAVFVLYGFLLLWVWLAIDAVGTSSGPNGIDFGVDFSHTYAAVHVLSAGHNPYDYHRLSTTQHALLSRYGLPVQPPSHAVLVGTSTFFLWVMQPFNAFPFQAIAIAWMLSTYALVGFVFLALLRHFGWHRRGLPTIIFLVTPAVVLGIYYGNMITLAFAAIAGSFPLLRRHPFLAGAVLSVSMLKLQIALPVAGLIVLFQAPHKGRVVAGFLTAFLARHLIAIALLGPAYQVWWLGSFVNFSRTMDLQPNIISLTGSYTALLPHTGEFALEIISIVLAGAITVAYWWRVRSEPTLPLLKTGWLWFLWMLATPYAHFIDEIVLVIPVIALIGVDGRHATRPISVVVLYLLGLSILLFSWTPMGIQLLWVPLVLCTGCFALVAHQYRFEGAAPVVVDHSYPHMKEAVSFVPQIAH
jgi:Glycosyltransferase family 87